MCCGKWARQTASYRPGLQKNIFQLVQGSTWQSPTRDCPGGQKVWESCLIFKDVVLNAQKQPVPMHRKTNQHRRDTARMNLGLLMELKCKRKFTWGRSGDGLPTRNTDATVPVSETVENTARIQWITMHYYLFSFSGEVNLLSENCLQSPLKVWYLISLINRTRFHRNWPLKISRQICLFVLMSFLSFLFPPLFLWLLKAFFFPTVWSAHPAQDQVNLIRMISIYVGLYILN